MTRAVAYAVVSAAFATLLCGVAQRLDSLSPGLTARYAARGQAQGPGQPLLTIIEGPPWLTHLPEAWHGNAAEAFGATWSGVVVAPYEDTYVFAITSDAGASLYIDGQALVEQVDRADARFGAGQIHLTRGAHVVFVEYGHTAGAPQFDFLWARQGAPLRSVPAWALRPRRVGNARLLPSLFLSVVPIALAWTWACLLVVVGIMTAAAVFRLTKRTLEREDLWAELRWILAASLFLTLVGLWWGLPAAWVQIELTPTFVVDGLSQHFSHGWFDAYPPFHYYVLAIAISPVLLLHHFGGMDVYGEAGHTLMVAVFRLVSAAAGAGMLVAACLAGVHAFGRRAGLLGAAVFALTTPFLYYAKTANVDVPYLFWFSLSFVFYLRLLSTVRLRDFVLVALTATLAICTKDQAYGFYLLVPFAVVYRLREENRRDAIPQPLLRAFVDRRVVAAAATAALLFAACHNLLFNFDGFLNHVRFIAGPGSESYRLFEPTVAGRWALLRLTVRLVALSMGLPFFLIGVAGMIFAARTPRLRRVSLWLVLPIVSYYFGFIDVILYNYDRFVLPMCFVLAIFGGLALDALLAHGQGRRWAVALVAVSFVYTVLYAGTVDVLMVRDSRYEAQRWMAAHVGRSDLVGVTEFPELLPGLDGYRTLSIGTVPELVRERPRYFVLNADYARAATPGTPWAELLAGLEQGTLDYRVIWRFRRAAPWPWLPGAHPDLVGPREEKDVVSVLRNINPLIEVFERNEP